MKKINKVILPLFCVSASISLLVGLSTSKIKETRADDEPQATLIGQFINPTYYSETTMVVIPQSSVSFIQSTGRTVYTEWVPGGGIIPPGPGELHGGGVSEPQGGHFGMVLQYYYYATPLQPKVQDVWNVYNDVDSFTRVIYYLEKTATFYCEYNSITFSNTLVNNLVLGYIRGVNQNYIDYDGEIIVGLSNSNFISFVNSIQLGLLSFADYFASFLPSSVCNTTLYDSISSACLANNYSLLHDVIIDDSDPDDIIYERLEIDAIHMIYAMDGIFLNTGAQINTMPFSFVPAIAYRNVVSWAGDLQTFIYSHKDSNLSNYTSFEDVLNESGGCFPVEDLNADIDAFNIAYNVDLGGEETYVSDLIGMYYETIGNMRFSTFVDLVGSSTTYYNGNNVQKFELLIKEFANLDANNTDWSNDLLLRPTKFKYLVNSTDENLLGTMPSLSSRITFSSLMIDYCLNRAQDEEE